MLWNKTCEPRLTADWSSGECRATFRYAEWFESRVMRHSHCYRDRKERFNPLSRWQYGILKTQIFSSASATVITRWTHSLTPHRQRRRHFKRFPELGLSSLLKTLESSLNCKLEEQRESREVTYPHTENSANFTSVRTSSTRPNEY
jgi:hypothetical protein